MKKSKFILAIISLLLLCTFALNMVGCKAEVKAVNLMDGVTPRFVAVSENLDTHNDNATDFAIRLFKTANENGKNTLISPLSVLYALAMTSNGAEGQTLAQMEEVFGLSVEELNLYLYSYMNTLPQGDKYKLSLANSIWFTDDERFTVNQEFLQSNADYYGAEIYKAPFDNQTVKDINNWVNKETDEMIPKIVEEIPEEAIMYLINALAFEAEWLEPYEKGQVRDKTFTKEDGTQQNVAFMHNAEGKYLEDENATGFVKYYKGGKYAFVALLPNEGISVSDYVNSLEGDTIKSLLENAQYRTVYTMVPKFETEYNTEMSEVLNTMGITNAFDGNNAEFGKMGQWSEGNIYISKVLHKTYIQVGEKGTKAGAVTAVQMDGNAAADPTEVKEVYLDRPFVYMIIDCENNIPFFIGTMMDVKQ